MARLDKTIKDYQEQLKDKGIKNIPEFVQSILDADVTKGKYSRFLLDCFLNDKFREEDLIGGLESTVGQAISLFHKHKNKLPEEMRSIYKYNSPGGLWNAVKQFDGALSGKEKKREEQDKIYAETKFVYEDEETGFKIISPLTEESAKWWGKGTRWCTSAENNNQFWTYASDAPLLILLMPGGEKLQLWKYGKSVQFMDEADNEPYMEYIEDNWNILEPIMNSYVRNLSYIPDPYVTEELCKFSVEQNAWSFNSIPEEFKTEEVCKTAFEKGLTLNHIFKTDKNEKFYQLAVEADGINLKFVPEHFKTEELCKIAVQNNIISIQYVPKSIFSEFSEKFYQLAIEANGANLQFVPEHLKTEELCYNAVKNNIISIQYVPESIFSEKFYQLAIQNEKIILGYIAKKHRTEELCKIAVQQDEMNLRYVPEHLKTEEMCKLAVQNNGNALCFVPKEMRTKELCKLAVQQNGETLFSVPGHLKTEEICKLALQNNKRVFQDIPENMLTEAICQFAVEQNGNALRHIPENMLTEELCKLAVQQDGSAIEFVPEQYKSKELLEIFSQQINLLQEKRKIKSVEQKSALDFDLNKKYESVFLEIRSCFPEKTHSLTM